MFPEYGYFERRVCPSDKQSEKGYQRRILRSQFNRGSAAGAVGFREHKSYLSIRQTQYVLQYISIESGAACRTMI
jgi:hypothetical protein